MENVEKEFDINHCDLTIAENKEKFLKGCLGDIYSALKKCGYEVTLGMLYDESTNLEEMREDFKWREVGREHGWPRQKYLRSYVVNNLPSGEWNVIFPCQLNWPSEGETVPAYYYVGTLKWNAETRECHMKGISISRENDYIVESFECNEPISSDMDMNWQLDDVVIAWKNGSNHSWNGTDWDSIEIQRAAIAKFVDYESQSCLKDLFDR